MLNILVAAGHTSVLLDKLQIGKLVVRETPTLPWFAHELQ